MSERFRLWHSCLWNRASVVIAAACALFTVIDTQAGEIAISEFRAGVLAHDIYEGWLPADLNKWTADGIEDVKFSVLFSSPDADVFRWMGAPQLQLGTSINLAGGDSLVHANLNWQLRSDNLPVFLDLAFGLGVTNGPASIYGCPVGFYSGVGLGFDVSDDVSLLLGYEHFSNADLCSNNRGLSNLGLTLAYRLP